MKMLFNGPTCLLHIYIVLATLLKFSSGFECKHNKTDLSALSGFPWVSWTDDTVDENISYKISLCSPLTPNGPGDHSCPTGSSICMIYNNGTSYSTGNFNTSADSLGGGTNEALGESWVILAGDPCPADPAYNLTTSINFKCGPTIGSPVFLDFTSCVSYFEWETNLYCATRNTVKEVPCYIYDDQGNRYDLSPLAKTKGGYLVSSKLDTDIYINVCRDIKPDSLTTGCPAGSAACKKNNGVFTGLGEPNEILKRGTDGRLTLKYVSPNSEAIAGCTTKPSTTVIFICPERGASKDPVVMEDFDCQYVIEWETEYACPETKLHNNSCVLTKGDADIDIDLRPLTKSSGSPYKTSWKDPSSSKDTTYDFYLNVCADNGIGCPDDSHKDKIPACQTIQDNSDFGKAMGNTDHTRLSYADGRLTLTYKGGEKCHHNNFQRQTVINFVCNQTAGNGNPVFENEDDCVYLFTWPTRYACLDHPVEESCRVDVGDRKYDLGPLSRRSGTNWMALHEQNDLYGRGQYFINVCHNILQTGDASRCDPGAAICYREYLSTRNLGRYESQPVSDSKTNNTIIKYTNGDICNDKTKTTITSTITFICKPGEGASAPSLIEVSNDKCFYEFEWHTAEACSLGHYTGTDCKIYADGLSFDLTPLKKETGSYKVDSPSDTSHEYFINVCGPITDKCQDLGIDNVGICQVPVNQNENSYVAGQAASTLSYYDGMINLTYTDGTPYNDDNKTPRRSEIAFICDHDAGKGQPHFIAEAASEHYYGFEWRTSYACPIEGKQCTAADEKLGLEYDISSLTMLDSSNWAIDGSSNTKYYINICQPLNKVSVGKGCDPFAAICRTKFENGQEKIDIPNMGRVDSRLQVVDKDRLKLVYKGGSCNNGTANVPYITNIEFMCRHNTLTSPPSAPIQDGPCEYTVVWDTPAACPLVKDIDTESCTTKDPNSDYVFNLSPLKRTEDSPYSINVDGTHYLINICGNISESKCPKSNGLPSGVCVVEDGKKHGLTEAGTKLDFREVGVMSLVYEGVRLESGQRVTAKILFVCAPDRDIGYPTFDHKVENTYIFKFYTALACTPVPNDCLVQDEAGDQYDLGSLIKNDFWTTTDMRDDKTKYYINVCAPVQNVPDSDCLDGPIGGCQVASNGKSYSIGYIQSKPIAHTDGSLTMHYRNGDICHKGTDRQAHRSTRINFFCSEMEHGPVFESETETCEYVFNWQTPAACQIKATTHGQCKVQDPLYNYMFDLNMLSISDYHVTVGKDEYTINVCKHITDTSKCSTAGVGVCRTQPQNAIFQPVNAGKANSILTYSGGRLLLNYTGGDNNCYTTIQFSCDLSQDGSKGPQFVEKSEEKCHYLFDWPTYHACPPRKSATCKVQDESGMTYDLTNLELLNDNYEVTDTVEKKRYLINVCRSLIHKENATCPYMAAACMVDLDKPETATDKYKSIGEPSGYQMTVESKQVIITYTNGDKCSNGKDNMTTHIIFTCDKNTVHSSPAGHFMVGECDHHFLWMSASACPLEDTSSGGGGKDITCQVTNPATGTVFDLSHLKAKPKGVPWQVKDKNSHLYEFNICAPLTNSKCTGADSSIGVCQSSEEHPDQPKYNAGKAVHDLWFDDGVVVQNLTGGDRCHNGKYERNTIITFMCNRHRGIGRPVFVDETEDCTYYISWHTNLVCEQELKCSVDTDDYRTIDLSLLSQDPDQIVHSTVDGSIFYLSVCSSLNPMPGILCPAGSGVCQVKPSDGVNHTSLGKAKSSPTYDAATKDITLMYVNGSQCDTDTTKNFTSRVIFSCLPGPFRSKPVFVRKADCEYVFQWDTYTVCTEKTQDDTCGYTDNNGDFYDFKKLQRDKPVEVKVQKKTKYLINMCGPIKSENTSSCNSHMVCRQEDGLSFGEPNNYKIVKEGQYIKMMYNSGGKCKGDTKAQSSIQFVCDRTADEKSSPIVLASMDCSVVFEWVTSYVCPTQQNPCSIVLDNHLYDLSMLSKIHGAWNVTDSEKNTYWINICTSVGGPNLPAVCDEKAAACLQLKNGGGDFIGSLAAQKKMYKNNTSGALVLEYGEGNPCTRNNDRPATTKINFICGSVFGAPEFVESDENKELCIYEFNWKTKFACKVESESMQMSNGQLKDKETGLIVDLKPIWNKSFEVDQKLDSGNQNIYKIMLNGNLTQCRNGVICQIKNKNIYRTLGSFASAKFTEDDWVIEATYTTGEKCSGDESSHNVTSIIQFQCSKKEVMPRLLYSKKDCFFMFIWETNHACLTSKSIVPSGGSASGNQASDSHSSKQPSDKGGVSTKTIVGIVATFLGAIVLCIIVVVFHKQERREACFLRMRGVFNRGRSEYSQLPTGTMDDIFGDEEEVVTVQNAAGDDNEEDPIITVTTTPASYHDDSDEDLLA